MLTHGIWVNSWRTLLYVACRCILTSMLTLGGGSKARMRGVHRGPRTSWCHVVFNSMRAIRSISFVLQWPAGISLHFHGPRALRVRVHGASARSTVCTRCTRASSHVQWTISMRVRGRAVVFVTFNAFAHMLSKCVFIAHSGVCHELNSLIWACGM